MRICNTKRSRTRQGRRPTRQAQHRHHRRRQHPASRRRAVQIARQASTSSIVPYATTPRVIVGAIPQRHPTDDRFLCGHEARLSDNKCAPLATVRRRARLSSGRADGRGGRRARLRGVSWNAVRAGWDATGRCRDVLNRAMRTEIADARSLKNALELGDRHQGEHARGR